MGLSSALNDFSFCWQWVGILPLIANRSGSVHQCTTVFTNLAHAELKCKSSPSYFYKHWKVLNGARRSGLFQHWPAIAGPSHPTHRGLQIQFYIRRIAKRWAFGLSICLISSCPCICNKAGDNTPFLHPSPAGSRGSCPTYLTILAPSLPFSTVASFVTCQLIRPCRHITSVGRQQGLEQLQVFYFF